MVCQSVRHSVTLMSPAQTAEPIEMQFRLGSWVGTGNHVLDGVQIPHGKGQSRGGDRGASHSRKQTLYSHLCNKSSAVAEMGDRGHKYPYELFLAFSLVAETLQYMCARQNTLDWIVLAGLR